MYHSACYIAVGHIFLLSLDNYYNHANGNIMVPVNGKLIATKWIK